MVFTLIMNIAICCIAYNRVESLRRLLNSLNSANYNEKVPLVISVDKSDTYDVENLAKSFEWKYGEKRIIRHQKNLGLRKHVLSCGELLNEFEAIIVLEDDVIVSPAFYQYSKQCVEHFYNDNRIAGISLYGWSMNSHNFFPFIPIKNNSDVYLLQLAQSWGQVWMRRQWKEFIDWYNKSFAPFCLQPHLPRSICYWSDKSWLKYHIKYCIEKQKYFVYPYCSLSSNNSEKGEHNKEVSTMFQVPMLYEYKTEFNIRPSIIYDAFFENELLYEVLHIDRALLCVDLYGNKGNREGKRYWLSTRKLGYEVIRSFGLQYKPLEINVIANVQGKAIFLYDTTKTKRCISYGSIRIVDYLFNYNSFYDHLKSIIKHIICYKYY